MVKYSALTLGLFLLGALAVAGCRTAATQAYLFPSMWPDTLARLSTPAAKAAGQAAPTLWVEPVILESERSGNPGGRLEESSTSRVLTNLLVQQLRAAGIRASASGQGTGEPDHVLTVLVPRLGYAEQLGYPKKYWYIAEMAYRLTDRKQKVVWQHQLDFVLDRSSLVDTMSRIPGKELEHQEVLINKCAAPLFKIAASGVAESLKEDHQSP